MSRRHRGKKLRNLIEANEKWYKVDTVPAPTSKQITDAIILHNKSYETGEPLRAHSQQQGWWGDRHLPQVYKPTIPKEPVKNDTWVCSIVDVKGCPIAETPQVRIPHEMYQAWTELAGEFDTEWMAYLIGTFDDVSGNAVITEMYFPPQSATGAHVEMPDENFRARPGTIAAVHSHVKMEAFFSSTDEAHANWPVEIVINARGESKMKARIKLGCGRYSRVEGKVLLTGGRASDVYRDQLTQAFVKEDKTATQPAGHPYYHGDLEGFKYS